MSKLLETVKQEKQDLRKLRQDREDLEQGPCEYSGGETQDLDVIHIPAGSDTSGHQQNRPQRVPSESTVSSSGASIRPDPRPVETPPTSPPMTGRFWPKLVRRLTLSPGLAAPTGQEICSIDLQPLGLKEKQIALSTDYKHFIFWTVERLGLYNDTSERELVVVSNPVENPGQMVASASYCAIVKRAHKFDEVRPHDNFHETS